MFYAGYALGVLSTFAFSVVSLYIGYRIVIASDGSIDAKPVKSSNPFIFKKSISQGSKRTPKFVTEAQQYQKEQTQAPKMTSWD